MPKRQVRHDLTHPSRLLQASAAEIRQELRHRRNRNPHPAHTTTVLLFIENCTSISPVAQGIICAVRKWHAAGSR
ncbi:Uncharacterised protein [Mycobacteroides abscessus subsp. massiliense]|nr:Uncharacterised protein [Mycobacteroides abscessus subsp. massiliense]